VNKALSNEIRKVSGDPTDVVWRWFVLNGPHGTRFKWGPSKNGPPGFVELEFLERIVREKEEHDASFPERARAVVRAALSSPDPNFVRRALQVAAVVGGDAELKQVLDFTSHESDEIASDAKASAFHLKKRLRNGTA